MRSRASFFPGENLDTYARHDGTRLRARRLVAIRATILILLLTCFFAASLEAQDTRSSKNGRRVLVSVKPVYPPTLRQAGIRGVVRLHATVLPNGSVSKVEIVGGNPVLAESAARAVMQWKYVPTAWQSSSEIEIEFIP